MTDVFSDLGYKATLTKPGERYDVIVELDDSRRFLIEVTGIDGQVSKAKEGR